MHEFFKFGAVAAWEGLVGLKLESGEVDYQTFIHFTSIYQNSLNLSLQDDSSSVFADECVQLLRHKREENVPISNALYHRSKAIRGLVDLVRGDLQSGLNHSFCRTPISSF